MGHKIHQKSQKYLKLLLALNIFFINALNPKKIFGHMSQMLKNSGIIYVFLKRPFLTPPYFDSISGNSFLQIIANPKYPTRCAWQAPSIMTGWYHWTGEATPAYIL